MWNLKQFQEIYSRYESSGLKVHDFCANEVINEAKFYYWQKKLREESVSAKGFAPIVLDTQNLRKHSVPPVSFECYNFIFLQVFMSYLSETGKTFRGGLEFFNI